MRGAPSPWRRLVNSTGIIPAYAGSTRSSRKAGGRCWDHPRVCGEHALDGEAREDLLGSSPRMRGAPTISRRTSSRVGIIPAYAGSTVCAACRARRPRDHPRVCGEHQIERTHIFAETGSSPRMRGAQGALANLAGNVRIIPAYAGSTWCRPRCGSRRGDHPRVCGEHLRLLR